MGTFGFLVALSVLICVVTASRPPICQPPPPWKLNGFDHMNNLKGNVTIVALLKASCPFCLWQASKLSRLHQDFRNANLTELRIIVINDDEQRSKYLFPKLRNKAHPLPVYQDNTDAERNETIWSLLNGGKDDFYIYDRCGRLAYYVPYPISFMYQPYAKAAVLSTYFDEPCGPCPEPAPEVAEVKLNAGNCTIDVSNSTTNCTIDEEGQLENITNDGVNVTGNFTTTEKPYVYQRNTISPNRIRFTPVLKELNDFFNNKSKENGPGRQHHMSPGRHHAHHNHGQHNHDGHHGHHRGQGKPDDSLHKHHHGHHRHQHVHHSQPNLGVEQSNSTRNESDVTDEGFNATTAIPITTAAPVHDNRSSAFYNKYYPNYEMILNLALSKWIKAPIPLTPKPTATLTTTKAPSMTISTPKQLHIATLVKSLRDKKLREQNENMH